RLDAIGDSPGGHVVFAGDVGERAMRLDMGYLVARRGRDRLQRADLIGDEILDLGGLQAENRPPAEAVQIAVAGMGADADAACFRQIHGMTHDIGIAGMEAAGDIDRRGKIDHGGVIAHFPRTKSFAKIAVEIDCGHDVHPPSVSGSSSRHQSGPKASAADGTCHVAASTALTAAPATLASCSASMFRSKPSMSWTRLGRLRISSANVRASACAAAMPTARNRKPRPAGIWANRPKSADMTVAIFG